MKKLLVIILTMANFAHAQIGAPVPWLNENLFNATGVLLPAGKLCTYAAGSTTPLATYSDKDLTNQNAINMRLGSDGRPQTDIYLDATSYKFVLRTAGTDSTCSTGTVVWTRDNVYDKAALYRASFATKLDDKVCHASQYTGAPNDVGGKIAACIAALPTTGGIIDSVGQEGGTISTDFMSGLSKVIEVRLGCGTYSLSTGITIPNNSKIVGLAGQGTQAGVQKCTILSKTNSFAAVTLSGVGSVLENVEINGAGQTGGGVVMTGGRSELRNVTVHNDGGVGIRVGADADTGNTNKVFLQNVTSYSNASHGLYVSSHATVAPDGNIGVYINFEATGNGGDGVRFNRASSNTVIGGQSQTNVGYGYNFVSDAYDSGNILMGVYAEGNNAAGVGCSGGPCDVFVGALSNGNRMVAYSVAASKISETSFSASRMLRINDETLRINSTTAVEIDTTAASNADINLNPGGTGQVTSSSFFRTQLSGAGILGFRQYYLTNKRAAMDYSEADGSLVIANYNNSGVINFAPQGGPGTIRTRINNDGNFEFVSGQGKIISTPGSLLNLSVVPDGGSLGLVAAVAITSSGLTVGSPTAGNKGSGTINVASDIYKNNSAYTNPDYAFERYFTGKIEKFAGNPGAATYPGIMPLPKLIAYIKKNNALPGVHEATGIFERGDILLEKLEEAYIYIMQLNSRLEKLEKR